MEENLKQFKDEICRHFDVVSERVENKIGIVSEQVAANTEQITSIQEKLKEHDERFGKIEDTLEVIKLDIEFIKNELKQKVSRDEFVILEKRVSMLEAKQK
jgi:archaellum component FlaC